MRPKVTQQGRRRAWEEVANQFNRRHPYNQRTPEEARAAWKNISMYAKTVFSDYLSSQR